MVFLRYLMFQLPGWIIASALAWGVGAWAEIELPWRFAFVGLFIAKDFIQFPFVRAAYEHSAHRPGQSVENEIGLVIVELSPEGWVSVGPERWHARITPACTVQRVERGAQVRVIELSGRTLVVDLYEPAPERDQPTIEVGRSDIRDPLT